MEKSNYNLLRNIYNTSKASKEDQETYVASTFDELVLNYELIWNDLLTTD